MKYVLAVCLIAVTAGVLVTSTASQSPALQKGISVQMATSSHAAAMPEADNENAWIVTVTTDGQIYFGTEQVTGEELTEQMKRRPRNRDAKLYVKADAGAPFQSVRQVLRSARDLLFDDVVLLTSQHEASLPGTVVPPKGLEVWIGLEAGSNFVSLQIGSPKSSSTLWVNNEPIAPSGLQSKMAKIFDSHSNGRIVIVSTEDDAPYSQVIRAIDACRGAGASRVTLMVASNI
jgi:biopolymer transport protein ExbD